MLKPLATIMLAMAVSVAAVWHVSSRYILRDVHGDQPAEHEEGAPSPDKFRLPVGRHGPDLAWRARERSDLSTCAQPKSVRRAGQPCQTLWEAMISEPHHRLKRPFKKALVRPKLAAN